MNYKTLTFDEWCDLDDVRDMAATMKDTRCTECNGTGSVECYACGHEEYCPECDGKGVYSVKQQLKEMYGTQRRRDVSSLDSWCRTTNIQSFAPAL